MGLSTIKKIQIIAHRKWQPKILSYMQKSGSVEIVDKAAELAEVQSEINKERKNYSYTVSQIKFAIDWLTPFETPKKQTLIEKILKDPIALTEDDLKKTASQFDYEGVVAKCQATEIGLNEAEGNITSLKDQQNLLEKWEKLDVKLSDIESTENFSSVFGTISEESIDEFIHELDKKVKEVELTKITTEEDTSYVVVTYKKDLEDELQKVFFVYDFEKVELPAIDKTPKEELETISEKIKKNEETIAKAKATSKELADSDLTNLKVMYDYLSWEGGQEEAKDNFTDTEYTFQLNAWVQSKDLKGFIRGLQKITKSFEVKQVKPEKGESVPVVLKNNALFEPFESVTNIYGAPLPKEPDPTPFLAPFFIVFFGLSLTDAGYGIMLTVISWLTIKILKIPREKSKLLRVLMFGGVLTFILGALFGGWFGINIDEMSGPVGEALRAIRIINPVEEPITVLLLTFVLGIIQVIAGLAVDMWWKIKNNHVVDGILDSGLWIYFILGFVFWALTKVGLFTNPAVVSIAFWFMLSGLVALVLTQGRAAKNPIVKLLNGIVSLYGLIGYFSDVLSYSRLLALGLATAIIGTVINLIASIFQDFIPYVGWLVALLILIGGHIFNVAINVLGAYIHSGRLQFVEFFPKFMEGGGKRFKPWYRAGKYIQVFDELPTTDSKKSKKAEK